MIVSASVTYFPGRFPERKRFLLSFISLYDCNLCYNDVHLIELKLKTKFTHGPSDIFPQEEHLTKYVASFFLF